MKLGAVVIEEADGRVHLAAYFDMNVFNGQSGYFVSLKLGEDIGPITRCGNVKNYKGVRPPLCRDETGGPCGVCELKWLVAEAKRQKGRR